ncbi:MAG: hypothetical protein ACHQ53_01235 [Polyangiales bacterium]
MLATLVIAFNRPHLLERLIPILAKHRPSPLFVAFDGPRPDVPSDRERIERGVRSVQQGVTWTDKLKLRTQPKNLGVRRNVSSAISWAIEQADPLVILEDDCLPNGSFYPFCAELLDRYRDDARMGVVSGTSFCPSQLQPRESYYLSNLVNCWGWATWRRAWQHYDDAMSSWPAFATSGELDRLFTTPSARRYWRRRLDRVKSGRIQSWAYRWELSCWASKLWTIQPARNLVSNVGFGADAANLAWPNDPLGRRPTLELPFPLVHPSRLETSKSLDDWVQAHVNESPLHHKLIRAFYRIRDRAGV